jgi:cytochrome c5
MNRPCIIAASSLFLLACGSLASSDPPPPEGPTGAECPLASTENYANFAKGFFDTYCIHCHGSTVTGMDRNGAPTDHNYDTLAGILAVGPAEIDAAAAAGPLRTNSFMPASDPRPTTDERFQLGEWLACKMPP